MNFGEKINLEKKEKIEPDFDFSKCQMNKIVEAYDSDKLVEHESFSPYLSDYNTNTGEIWKDNLRKEDEIGLEIAKVLKEQFPKARMISLYDEYNSNLPDSSDPSGKPLVNGPQMKFSEDTKNNFKNSLKKILEHKNIIKKEDHENEAYLFVSESSKIKDAEELVEKLDAQGFIEKDGEAIYFKNPNSENEEYKEVMLRTKNGRWLCEALDASSYIKPENLEITHLIILSNEFKKQQDKVWEILRSLGIKPTNYHNIFFNKDLSSQKITETIKAEIEKNKK